MGLGSSRSHRRRSTMSDGDRMDGSSYRLGGVDDDEEPDLPSIVAYLIRSGQIRFVSQDEEGMSEGEDSSDNEFVGPSKTPSVDPNPDSSRLRKSDIFASVMQTSGRWTDKRWLSMAHPHIPNLIHKRQIGINRQQMFTPGDRCVLHSRFLPNKCSLLASYHHKAFCGTYSQDGNVFLSACQDQNVRIYDTSQESFKLIKTIRARDVGWSVLDTAFSPDGCYMAYSSWSDSIHLCNIFGDHDVHETLQLNPGDHSFCIFSLMFSSDNREIMGGANDKHLYVYDRETSQRILKIDAHDDDVNAVSFADNSSQILYSGGDDGLCKVWDRRTLRESRPVPVGLLAGHHDGITFIDTKVRDVHGDGDTY